MNQWQTILNWINEGKSVALATVIWKQGSALRPEGAKMAISSDMEIDGSVSGGCVEGAVIEEALTLMKTGSLSVVNYGIADETAWSVGLTCGGKIRILIQAVSIGASESLSWLMVQKLVELEPVAHPICLLTVFNGKSTGETAIITEGKKIYPKKDPEWLQPSLLKEIAKLENTESSGILTSEISEIFVEWFFPKPRLVIIGAAHIAMPLAKMARICGFTTIVIDPRKVFAAGDRFPDVDELIIEWPTDGLEKIKLCERDYLLALSHDDKLDLPALQMALDKRVRYIGMLSSRKTRDSRYKKLETMGYSKRQISRVHAPVGLDLGGQSPEEIALAILAEITAVRYGKHQGKQNS